MRQELLSCVFVQPPGGCFLRGRVLVCCRQTPARLWPQWSLGGVSVREPRVQLCGMKTSPGSSSEDDFESQPQPVCTERGLVAPILLTQWGQPAGWGQCPLAGCGRSAVTNQIPGARRHCHLDHRGPTSHTLINPPSSPHSRSLTPVTCRPGDPSGFSPAPPPGTESPPAFVPLPTEVGGFGGLGGHVQNRTRARPSRWRRSTLSRSWA